ncbi:general stress protein [Brevibacterium sp. UCMA 11754]|uniref:general stress protein n=1 Tax=Brevibacterium sp. UCMA 11754 TaxID=2749198 RepID=UPI001F3D49A6|nr:general stress protein [Brevibacterium sp. UCMA 11754]MCF2573925.1 general stress protein [Brevibacterium sp. UCMA 11754]
MKPTVKAFQDDIGLLNELKKQASKGAPKESLHVFAHDDARIDCIVGHATSQPADIAHLVADRYNEEDSELRTVFSGFGFDLEECDDLETKLANGKLLLVIGQSD